MTDPTIIANQVRTARTATFVRQIPGREHADPVLLIHGNLCASEFFGPLMRAMPRRFRPLAADLRGFGGSDPEPVDATRGVRDFSDDLLALLDALGLDRAHLVGWSLGGSVAMQVAIDAPQRVSSMTLIAPISPYGFGGTVDASGTLLAPDGAGSGSALVSRIFVQALADRDTSIENRGGAPSLLRRFYLGAGWDGSDEQIYVASMFATAIGPENYPGDRADSPHWPGFSPGTGGVMNAISPKYLDVSAFAEIEPAPHVLWIRGNDDAVISDASGMDPAVRALAGSIAGYPGPVLAPPQPMLAQTRAVLDRCAARGGAYREYVIPGAGHAPHITALPELMEVLIAHLDGAARE